MKRTFFLGILLGILWFLCRTLAQDTDGDNVDDRAEFVGGSNPLGGLVTPAGQMIGSEAEAKGIL